MTTESRTARDAPRETRVVDTRERKERRKKWVNPNKLRDPEPRNGMVFRWIRAELLGERDGKNLAAKKREGWEPVPLSEAEEFADFHNPTSGMIEYGGLILCWTDEDVVRERNEYYSKRARDQLVAVDNNYMRESDPRMPLGRPERRTSESFGRGRP